MRKQTDQCDPGRLAKCRAVGTYTTHGNPEDALAEQTYAEIQCDVPGGGTIFGGWQLVTNTVAELVSDWEMRVDPEQCPLIPLIGDYKSGSNVVALFAPDLAYKVDAALAILNAQGIVPTITDGFRTRADQQARWDKYQAALAKGVPVCGTVAPGVPCTYPAARPGTGIHEIGDGIDFGSNSNGSNWGTIRDVLNSIAGLNWGAAFHDVIHWETAHSPSQSQIANCEREHP